MDGRTGRQSRKKSCIFNISQKLFDIFSQLFLCHLEEFLRHFLRKSRKKSKFLNLSKNFERFFSGIFSTFYIEKKYISQKLFNIFSQLFCVLLEVFLRHFLRKTQKKSKKLKFSKNFEQLFFFSVFFDFLSKKANFSKTIQYFFLVVSLPPRRVFKTFSKKISKKIKKMKFVKKNRTFFFNDFFYFLSKKANFAKTIPYFFVVVSLPPRRVLKTFSEKNSKKIKKIIFF